MNSTEILSRLCQPGRKLIFTDDSGTPNKPLPNLYRDFCLQCGVVIASENYHLIKSRIRIFLNTLGGDIKEFHATEIINPPSQSAWKDISIDNRKAAIELLTKTAIDYAEQIIYCYVTGAEYSPKPEEKVLFNSASQDHTASHMPLHQKIEFEGLSHVDHKKALYNVFLNALIAHISWQEETAIVMDHSKSFPLSSSKEIVLEIATPKVLKVPLYQNGFISTDSWVEEGLQLADFVSYIINREKHIEYRILQGKSNHFDELILNALEQLRSKFRDLLL